MADFNIQPVGTQIKPVQPMSLADMVNMARGVQAYQQAEAVNPELAQQAKIETEVARETAQPKIRKAGAEATTAEIGSKAAQLGFEEKQFKKIADSQISMINNPLVIQAEKDPSSVDPKALSELVLSRGLMTGKSLGVPEEKTRQLLSPYLDVADKNPGALRQYYKERHLQAIDDVARTTALAASGVPITTGAGGYAIQTGEFGPVKPGEVIPGTAYQQLLGPGSQIKITDERDVNNNQIAFVSSADGKQVYRTTVPNGSPSGTYSLGTVSQQNQRQGFTPPGMIREGQQPTTIQLVNQGAPAAVVPPPGESSQTGELYQKEIIDARSQAQPANIALNNVRTIRQYLPLASTGKYSEAISGLQSVLGNVAGSKPEEIAAAARDIIEKNMADLAIQKNAALGGKFAADLSAVQSSLASAGKNPTAIAKVMDQLEPLLQHVYNYQHGLDLAVQKSPQKQFIKPDFDRKMNDAFEIKALMMYNAWKNGGDAGLKKFNKENNIDLKEQSRLFNKLKQYNKLTEGEM
jgi:hypothetical protein